VNNGNEIASSLGDRKCVYLADLDSDGSADYVYVYPDGTFDVFLNRGPADNAYSWS
jgi:hypothetical protein